MNVSKLIIVGKVGRDAEMRYTPSGQAVTSFSVAVNNNYTNSAGEKVKETTWFRVSCWGKLAENCNEYVRKGMEVYVEGRLTPAPDGRARVYESNGTHKASFEVNASIVQFGTGGDKKPAQDAIQGDPDPF